MLNEFEIDQLRQLVHAYSLSDVLRGLQVVCRIDSEEASITSRTAPAAAWRKAAETVGAAAAAVYTEVG